MKYLLFINSRNVDTSYKNYYGYIFDTAKNQKKKKKKVPNFDIKPVDFHKLKPYMFGLWTPSETTPTKVTAMIKREIPMIMILLNLSYRSASSS
jgi:hypothetical protein